MSNVIINKKRGKKRAVVFPNGMSADYYRGLLETIKTEFLPIVDELNNGLPEDLKINFGLKINENGEIKGRSTSYFCLTLNDKKRDHFDTTMEKRSDFLKRVGLNTYTEVYDITAEVPRTTVLINTGKWMPDTVDLYTQMIECIDTKDSGLVIDRETMKKLYMRFAFDKGSYKVSFNHYKRQRVKDLHKKICKSRPETKKEVIRAYYEYLTEKGLEYTKEGWLKLSYAVEAVQGKTWRNLTFWWTSLIQIYTIYTIWKEKSIRVFNVYDGFYGPENITKDYIMGVVEKSAYYIYGKYINTV